LGPAGTVTVVKVVEQNDPALIGVVETFVGKMDTSYAMVDQHHWLNPHDFTARILKIGRAPECGRG
jgi:hypothetical protein